MARTIQGSPEASPEVQWCEQVSIGGCNLASLWPKAHEHDQCRVYRHWEDDHHLFQMNLSAGKAGMASPDDLIVMQTLVQAAISSGESVITANYLTEVGLEPLARIFGLGILLQEFDKDEGFLGSRHLSLVDSYRYHETQKKIDWVSLGSVWRELFHGKGVNIKHL